MKICIDARKINDMGIGTYLRNILIQFSQLNHSCTFFLLCPAVIMNQYKNMFPAPMFSLLAEQAGKYSFRELFSIANKIKKTSADLYFSPHYVIPFVKVKPTVTMVHDLIHLKFPEYLPSSLARIYAKKMIKHAIKSSDMIVTVSQNSKNDLLDYFDIDEKKIAVIYGAVHETFTQLSPSDWQETIAKDMRIDGDYILYCGAFKPHKNIPVLLKAFQKIKPELCPYLVLTGDKLSNYPDLISLVHDLQLQPRIIQLNWFSQKLLAKLYNGARLFVFPSWYEGFGLPPLEAMSCGVPVICSNAACMPEVLGDAAVYFPPDSPAQLSEKMTHVLSNNDIQKNCIRKGLLQAQKYSWRNSAQNMLNLFERLVS